MPDDPGITVNVVSDVGCVRTANEDSVLSVFPHDPDILEKRGVLVVVCDGMGGHSGGEVASRIAVETIHRSYYGEDRKGPVTLAEAILAANRAIFAAAKADVQLAGMGTTCTAVVLKDGGVECGHVGDSRLYLIRGGQIYQLTEDHSAVRSMVARGLLSAAEAQNHAEKNVILRAVGTHPTVEVTTWEQPFPYWPGDRFVLCSDGLHDLVADEEIRTQAAGDDPQAACDTLVALAKSRGGHDNITVALIRIDRPDEARAAAAGETRTQQVPA